jgi:uncharacterized protein YkwD
MPHRLVIVLGFIVLLSLLAAGRVEPAAPPVRKPRPRGFQLSEEEKALLEATNEERRKHKLRPLRANPWLFEAARKHSANMAKQQKVGHVLDGKNPADRLRALGYRHRGCGENCAMGNRPPAQVVRGWMESPGHRRNILNRSFGEIGLGVAVDEDGRRYWAQVFAAPARR